MVSVVGLSLVVAMSQGLAQEVRLKGAEEMHWGAGSPNANSVAGSLAAAMAIVGETEYDYTYLMGVSGQAFRIQFYDKEPHGSCPSSPHAMVGAQCGNRMFDAVPYAFTIVEGNDAEAREKVAACLRAGKPVIPFSEESGLIDSYTDGGKTIFIRSYWDGGKKQTELKEMPWGFSLLADKRNMKPRRQQVEESLGFAVQNMRPMHSGAYATGWNAYRVWRQRLLDPWLEECTRDEQMGFCHANAFIYECLLDARIQAAKYLRREAPLFESEAKSRMLKAAGIFEKFSEAMKAKGSYTDIAPYPMMLKPEERWSKDRREKQVRKLEAVEKLDREAFHELEKALDAAGVSER